MLKQAPERITAKYLKQFPEFLTFQTKRNQVDDVSEEYEADTQTPEEDIETAYQAIREGLAAELLQIIKPHSPTFFERLVIDLLVKMGYGGTRKDAGQAIGKSGDEGIDGIIKEDR